MKPVRTMRTAVMRLHIDIRPAAALNGVETENLNIAVTLNEGHHRHLAHYNIARTPIKLK